jgi:drug/metabolite transporter (DMT)-like permease
MINMDNGRAETSPTLAGRSTALLLVVAVGAIILMPFVAGRHPSGAQTMLIFVACVALTTIAFGLLAYGGRRQASAAPAGARQLPPPDELMMYRRRASR